MLGVRRARMPVRVMEAAHCSAKEALEDGMLWVSSAGESGAQKINCPESTQGLHTISLGLKLIEDLIFIESSQ